MSAINSFISILMLCCIILPVNLVLGVEEGNAAGGVVEVSKCLVAGQEVNEVRDVQVISSEKGKPEHQLFRRGDWLPPGIEIIAPARTVIIFTSINGNLITLNPGSRLHINMVSGKSESYTILDGLFNFEIFKALSFFKVNYQTFVALVKGTRYSVEVEPGKDIRFTVSQGKVETIRDVEVKIEADNKVFTGLREAEVISAEERRSVSYRLDGGDIKVFKTYKDAEDYYQRQLEEDLKSGDDERIRRGRNNLNQILLNHGKFQESTPYCHGWVVMLGDDQLYTIKNYVADAEVVNIYPEAELANDKARLEKAINQMFDTLSASMYWPKKKSLSNVAFQVPLKGKDRSLLEFYSLGGETPTVVLPVLSLKFIEDMSIAYAWRYLSRYSLEPMDEYMAMLKYRRSEDFPNAQKPAPLDALGIPPKIWERDKGVDDLSLEFRNTAWLFILAHALGHLYYNHPDNRDVDPSISQRNEIEADEFAVNLLNRLDIPLVGIILWFQMSVDYFPNRADFRTETEYLEWMQREATHPVNSARIQHLALMLNRAADASLSREQAEVLRIIAVKTAEIGDILTKPYMQRLIARCAVLGHPEDLKRLHGRPCDKPIECSKE